MQKVTNRCRYTEGDGHHAS